MRDKILMVGLLLLGFSVKGSAQYNKILEVVGYYHRRTSWRWVII